MVILHFKTGTWILRPESISVTCTSLFVGLPLLQVRQSPCFDDLTEKIAQKRKTQKTNSPLEQGLTHTHTISMAGTKYPQTSTRILNHFTRTKKPSQKTLQKLQNTCHHRLSRRFVKQLQAFRWKCSQNARSINTDKPERFRVLG